MNAPVDVLQAMDSASRNLFEVGRCADGRRLDEARAVVADLIASAPELHAAATAIIAAIRDYLPPDGITKDAFISRVVAAMDNERIVEIMK